MAADRENIRVLTGLLRSSDDAQFVRMRQLLRERGIDPTQLPLPTSLPTTPSLILGYWSHVTDEPIRSDLITCTSASKKAFSRSGLILQRRTQVRSTAMRSPLRLQCCAHVSLNLQRN
jgi:hypothetical protein